ncbi:MAG: hypothetical protein ISS71_02130 [Phycisphaerae bacterium]|nr:hypothetical protein [Phycisphaerae bacterium]
MDVKRNGNRKDWMGAGMWMVIVLGLAILPLGHVQQVNAESVVVAAVDSESAEMAAEEDRVQEALTGQSIQTISFKKDMPIKDALRMLAQMYQKNIVPSAAVDGIVTVTNLYDVTFEEALQAILGTHKYEIKGSFIKVYTNEEFMADKSRFENALIPLYYINAAEAQKLAEPLLSENGQLGVTSPAAVDTMPGMGGDTLSIRDRLVVNDYPENIRKIKETLEQVDIQPPQVLIEVTYLKAVLDETTEFGIDWQNLSATTGVALGTSGISAGGFASGVSTGGLSVGILEDNVEILIRALDTITDTTILANPKIMALNKQAGKIIIGDRKGYLSSESVSDGGTSTQEVAFLETGTVLEFRPFICKDGMIRMELYPKQSTGTVSEVASGTVLPNETTTEVMTNVMVKDGKTIVLGGLFQEETTLSRSQIPLLGDLPIIGELFRGIDDQSVRTELIVLITPHIINDPEEADGTDRMKDVMRLAYDARKNITWMSRARIEEDRYAKAVKLYTDGQPEAALALLNCQYNDMDRGYLDELRLKERIISETQPDQVDQIEQIMLRALEKEESGKWIRR